MQRRSWISIGRRTEEWQTTVKQHQKLNKNLKMQGTESKLLLWEYEPGVADLTERQQELYQDLAFLIEEASPFSSHNREDDSALKQPDVPPSTCFPDAQASLPPSLSAEEARLRGLETDAINMKDHLLQASEHLGELLSTLVTVKEKTDALYGDCEDLVQKQQQLAATADILHAKMAPLLDFDRLAVQLNAPGLNVTTSSFFELMDKLQASMGHVETTVEFKESSLFKTKYSQLFSKATTLIRNEVNRNFQAAARASLITLPSGEDSRDIFANLYSTFQHIFGPTRTLIRDVDERALKHPEYYADLIQDCHQIYFSSRRLVYPFYLSTLAGFRKQAKNSVVDFLRSVSSFLVRVCREEFRLYHQYFSQPSPALADFLNEICQQFYDGVRPEIIHLDQVEKISDVCCFLNQELVREAGDEISLEVVPFVEFIRLLLADARERLMFRIHAFVTQDIAGYRWSQGDLAYPEKLEVLHQLMQASKEDSRNRMSSRASISSVSSRAYEERYLFSVESQGFWFPTLRRAVGLIGKLFNSLDAQSFKMIAQEVIFHTLTSLTKASAELQKTKGPMHSDLFLISHVLVLREHLTLYQMDMSTEETSLDFSKVYDAARTMVSRTSTIFTLSSRNALLDFFLHSAPDVKTSTVDCRKEVDSRLRTVCLRLVDFLSAKILGPLPSFLEKAEVILSMQKPDSPIKLSNQSFASPNDVKDLIAMVYKNVKIELPVILTQFLLYLISIDTLFVLYKPIRMKIWRCLERTNKVIQEGYEEDDRAIIAFPSLEQWNILLNITPSKPVFKSAVVASKPSSNIPSVSEVQHV